MFLLYCDSEEPDIWTATGPMMYTAPNDESMLFATSTMELAEHVQKRFGKGFGTIRARRSHGGKGCTQRRVSVFACDLDRRTDKNPTLGGLLHPRLWASAQETPAALCLASPGKRTRRRRRVRTAVCLRPVSWQPMTGVRCNQYSPQTYPDDSDQAPYRSLLRLLRFKNIHVSYLSRNRPKAD